MRSQVRALSPRRSKKFIDILLIVEEKGTGMACPPQRGVAQLRRALRSGRRGRWFESSHPDFFVDDFSYAIQVLLCSFKLEV